MDLRVRDAYVAASRGYSPDRVVAEPQLDAEFLADCRRRGLGQSDEELNRILLNGRKAGALRGIRTLRRTSFPRESECRFVSEIAFRFLERRDGVTLDDVVCSPTRAAEFDQVAARILPGFQAVHYRWAALNLRKKRKLRPELLGQVCRPLRVINSAVDALDPASIPAQQGLYILFDAERALYVGEAQDLRKRLAKHLEHSDNKGLARWLWEHGPDTLNLEVQVLPDQTPTKVRRALEAELIESRKPVFNLRGK